MTLNLNFTAKKTFLTICHVKSVLVLIYTKKYDEFKIIRILSFFGPYFLKNALKSSKFTIKSIILIWFKLELQDVTILKVVYGLTSLA